MPRHERKPRVFDDGTIPLTFDAGYEHYVGHEEPAPAEKGNAGRAAAYCLGCDRMVPIAEVRLAPKNRRPHPWTEMQLNPEVEDEL